MAKKTRRTYSREFKREAIRLWESSHKSMSEIEQDLGITPHLLSKWVRLARQEEEQAFPGKGQQREREAELTRLRREVAVLRQERDILKKALTIFSADQD